MDWNSSVRMSSVSSQWRNFHISEQYARTRIGIMVSWTLSSMQILQTLRFDQCAGYASLGQRHEFVNLQDIDTRHNISGRQEARPIRAEGYVV